MKDGVQIILTACSELRQEFEAHGSRFHGLALIALSPSQFRMANQWVWFREKTSVPELIYHVVPKQKNQKMNIWRVAEGGGKDVPFRWSDFLFEGWNVRDNSAHYAKLSDQHHVRLTWRAILYNGPSLHSSNCWSKKSLDKFMFLSQLLRLGVVG